jgi:tetratricopeptide (TPR) repeat protein
MSAALFLLLLLFSGRAALLADAVAAPAETGSFGRVEFANSGAPAAQADFAAGMALLHDFEYPAAAEAFRRAQAADPGFAMAYWGEAMTFNHPIWMQQDAPAARAALARLAPTATERLAKAPTAREKAWLAAVETLYGEEVAGASDTPPAAALQAKYARDLQYEHALSALHEAYPDDVDAAAFHALALLGTAHAGRDVAIYMRAAGILEQAWIDHREHPGVLHYLIHCYDDPTHAPLGLRAARRYAAVAPDAGHAIHMTSHIFFALGMWQETVDTNIAAIAAVDRMRAAKGKSPVACGHYPAWLAYAHLQLGQTAAAKSLLSACRAAAAIEKPADEPGHVMDADASLGSEFANMRLVYLLASGDWRGEVAAWELPPIVGTAARLDFAFARAVASIGGDAEEIRRAMADLEAVGREVIAAEKAKDEADPSYRVRPEIFRLEAGALLAESRRDFAAAEKLAREAVALEDALPVAFGPPTIDLPARELLGNFLLRRGRRDEARDEFARALALAPGRRAAQVGLATAAGVDAAGATTPAGGR